MACIDHHAGISPEGKKIPQSLLFGAAAIDEFIVGNDLPKMMPLIRKLWPICRSLTGPGVRETLDIIAESIPLERYFVNSGSTIFDWTVPPEWRIQEAYIESESGKRIIDFKNNNLHVVQYSEPVDTTLSLEALQKRLHSIPEQPNAIPYITSYYNRTWGFCLSEMERSQLKEGQYHCVINSELDEFGQLDYAQCRLEQKSEEQTLLFSTYVCHPSMANNELSGPAVQTALFRILQNIVGLRLNYCGAYTTETLGTLCYLHRFGKSLRENVIGGAVITCVGDDGPYTYIKSRRDHSVSDQLTSHVFRHLHKENSHIRPFHPIGSDERQYCSPGFDFPTGSFSRTRYEDFPEYHTSLDNLDFVTEVALQGSLLTLLRVCQAFEMMLYPIRTNPFGEPQLGKRNIYKTDRTSALGMTEDILFILAYSGGVHSTLQIAEKMNKPIWDLLPVLQLLEHHRLIDLCPSVQAHSSLTML